MHGNVATERDDGGKRRSQRRRGGDQPTLFELECDCEPMIGIVNDVCHCNLVRYDADVVKQGPGRGGERWEKVHRLAVYQAEYEAGSALILPSENTNIVDLTEQTGARRSNCMSASTWVKPLTSRPIQCEIRRHQRLIFPLSIDQRVTVGADI